MRYAVCGTQCARFYVPCEHALYDMLYATRCPLSLLCCISCATCYVICCMPYATCDMPSSRCYMLHATCRMTRHAVQHTNHNTYDACRMLTGAIQLSTGRELYRLRVVGTLSVVLLSVTGTFRLVVLLSVVGTFRGPLSGVPSL